MSYSRKSLKNNSPETMTYDPKIPETALPFVRGDFWRASIGIFEPVFLSWMSGVSSDAEMLAACAKFQYMLRETRTRHKSVEPYNRSNGATLGEEMDVSRLRCWSTEDAIQKMGYSCVEAIDIPAGCDFESLEGKRLAYYLDTIFGEFDPKFGHETYYPPGSPRPRVS